MLRFTLYYRFYRCQFNSAGLQRYHAQYQGPLYYSSRLDAATSYSKETEPPGYLSQA